MPCYPRHPQLLEISPATEHSRGQPEFALEGDGQVLGMRKAAAACDFLRLPDCQAASIVIGAEELGRFRGVLLQPPSDAVLSPPGPQGAFDSREGKVPEVPLQEGLRRQPSDRLFVIAHMRQRKVEPVAKQFDGRNAGLAQRRGQVGIVDERQHAVAVPAAQPVRSVVTGRTRVQRKRPAPVRFDEFRNAAEDAASVSAAFVHADGDVAVGPL
jgi:hypothetical protein